MVPGILVNMVIFGDLEYNEGSLCCIQEKRVYIAFSTHPPAVCGMCPYAASPQTEKARCLFRQETCKSLKFPPNLQNPKFALQPEKSIHKFQEYGDEIKDTFYFSWCFFFYLFFFLLFSNEKGHRNKGVPEILPGVISAWKDRQGPSGHEKQALLFPLRCLYQWCLGKHLSPLVR